MLVLTKGSNLSHVMRNLFLPYVNNEGADQPAHPRSLISAFVVRCLDRIILLVSIGQFESTRSQTPEDRFVTRLVSN